MKLNELLDISVSQYNPLNESIDFLKHALQIGREIIIFPAGTVASGFYNALSHYDIIPNYFGDNSTTRIGTTLYNVPILSFSEIHQHHKDAVIIIGTRIYKTNIIKQFLENGFASDSLIYVDFTFLHQMKEANFFSSISQHFDSFSDLLSLLNDDLSKATFLAKLKYMLTLDSTDLMNCYVPANMYFDPSVYSLSGSESVISGGGFTGDTFMEFIKLVSDYKEYHIFEPNQKNFKVLQNNVSSYKNVYLNNKGLWSHSDILQFSLQSGASHIETAKSSSGNEICNLPVTSIDEYLAGKKITLIKLDIEGAEHKALEGSQYTIHEHNPKLAICIYHKPMDILELPLYMHELNPSGRLYIRHYGISGNDTVCYLIP